MHPFCGKEAVMTIDGCTDLHRGWETGAEDAREGSEHSHTNWPEGNRQGGGRTSKQKNATQKE